MARDRLNDVEDGWLGQRPAMDDEDLRQWCAERNRWCEDLGIEAWYIVTCHRQGNRTSHAVVKIEGLRAVEMRAKARGKPIEWYRPTPEDAAACHAFARRCMDQNMTAEEFREFVRRTGGAKRVTADGELI